jgi:hypothetical protein
VTTGHLLRPQGPTGTRPGSATAAVVPLQSRVVTHISVPTAQRESMQPRWPPATSAMLASVALAALVSSAVAATVYCPTGNGVSTQEIVSGGYRYVNATGTSAGCFHLHWLTAGSEKGRAREQENLGSKHLRPIAPAAAADSEGKPQPRRVE